MDDELAKDGPRVQADNQSIAIGEINITGTVTGNITIGHTIVQPADARLRHELGILLKNVETTWIQGVLEKSVHEAALLELGLELHEEAVDNPWRMVIEGPDQTRETLPRGRRIKDIFDEANRLLLILGEPGSGKTTILLQLARDLIAEVDLSTFTQPVPVILNLSTWTNKQQPLDEWLVAELNSKYRLPKKDGQRWLKERRILPLLDGLDEVRAENRAACVERINQLVVDYGLQGLVVCSRVKDYTALNVRLAFYRAIYIQPLTPEQVDEYLNDAGDKLASLRTTLHADPALRSMAQSPLILNVMSLAYQNTSAEDLSDPALNTDKTRRKHLFDTYIARMFTRKAGTRPYSDEQTRQWLSWLARNMQKHNQEIFLIENLQPSWLQTRGWRWVYFLASRLISGLSFFLSLSFLFGWASDLSSVLSLGLLFEWLVIRAIQQIFGLTIIGLLVGLSIGLIDNLRFEWLRNHRGMRKPPIFWWSVINIVAIFLLVGLIFGLLFVVVFGRVYELSQTLFFGMNVGLSAGLIFGIRGSRQSSEIDIKTIEALHWYWRKAFVGGLVGGIVGLLLGLSLLVFFRPIAELRDRLSFVLSIGLIFGLLFGLMGLILNGLRYEIIETKSGPNQGIRLSMRNAIFGGLLFGLSVGLMASILGTLWGVVDGPSYGLGYGLMGALWYGGIDVIQHFTLRLILLIQRHTPRNYAHFLDYAVDRIFLQKVGGAIASSTGCCWSTSQR